MKYDPGKVSMLLDGRELTYIKPTDDYSPEAMRDTCLERIAETKKNLNLVLDRLAKEIEEHYQCAQKRIKQQS